VAILLRRGHKVAVPVVDDDGVDLIVDYAWTVQVKSRQRMPPGRTPHLTLAQTGTRRNLAGVARTRRSAVRPHVDVFAIWVESAGWWVIPREAMSEWSITLGPQFDCYRDGWDLFERSGDGSQRRERSAG